MRSNIANVLDLELTCYENGVFPPGEVAEIIEFGLTMVDLRSRTTIKTLSIPVIPTMSKVSPFCTQLTGWTEAKLLRQGVPFSEACRRIFEKYGGRNRILVVDSDRETELIRSQVERERLRHDDQRTAQATAETEKGIVYPFGGRGLNVSTLFDLLTQQASDGLEQMLAALGMTFEGCRHRASDDSKNIARVLINLLELSSGGKLPLPQANNKNILSGE